MEDLTRLNASWRAYKAHITRLFHKIDDSLEAEVDDYTITALTTAIEQLDGKKSKILELDAQITTLIMDPDDLTAAVIDSGELEDSNHR